MRKKSSSKSAFFHPRALIGFGLCLIGLLLALLAYTAYPGASLLAQRPGPGRQTVQQPAWQPHWQVVSDSHHDLSPPLRNLALLPVPPSRDHEGPKNPRIPFNHAVKDRPDPVVQRHFLNSLTVNIPNPILNFDGQVFPAGGCDCAPPDDNGYAGLTQYSSGSKQRPSSLRQVHRCVGLRSRGHRVNLGWLWRYLQSRPRRTHRAI